jgi:hypothetical protein
MAITFVGSGVGTHAATSTQTINFSTLLNAAGSAPTLAQGDMVIVAYHQTANSTIASGTRSAAQMTPAGYTSLTSTIIGTDTNITSSLVSNKFMTSTPDTSVGIPASVSTTMGVAYDIHVFRGVDIDNPLDVAVATISGTNGGQPDPPSITPASPGAWIFLFGSSAMAAGAAFQSAAPTGLSTTTNAWRQAVITTTTNDAAIGAGYKDDWTSGAFNCAAFTGGTTTNTGSWASAAIALRPLILRRLKPRYSYFAT